MAVDTRLNDRPPQQYGALDVNIPTNQQLFDQKNLGKLACFFSVVSVIGVAGVILAENYMKTNNTTLNNAVIYTTVGVTLVVMTLAVAAINQLCKCDRRIPNDLPLMRI